MRHYMMRYLVFIAVWASMTHAVHALSMFDEAILGDFSNSASVPTLLSFTPGVNIVRMTTGPSNSDRNDYFQIDRAGMTLLSIVIQDFSPGLKNTTTRLENCDQPGNSCAGKGQPNQVMITTGDIARDVMPDLLQGSGLSDFFRIEENRGPAAMEIAFVTEIPVTPTPEPDTGLLFGTGLVGWLGYSWRRRKQTTTTI